MAGGVVTAAPGILEYWKQARVEFGRSRKREKSELRLLTLRVQNGRLGRIMKLCLVWLALLELGWESYKTACHDSPFLLWTTIRYSTVLYVDVAALLIRIELHGSANGKGRWIHCTCCLS